MSISTLKYENKELLPLSKLGSLEQKVHSQNGEDGIIEALFQKSRNDK